MRLIYIPEVLKDFIYSPKIKVLTAEERKLLIKHEQDCYYFCYLLYREKIYKKKSKTEFIRLKHAYLKQQVINFTKLVNILQKLDIIKVDNYYVVGEQSRGYKLTDFYRKSNFYTYHLTNKFLLKRLTKWYSQEEKLLDPICLALKSNLQKLVFDAKGAFAEISLSEDKEKENTDLLAVTAWQDGNIRCNRCSYGRIHTNLTNLSKNLRKYVTLPNEELVEIDIICSQPLVFCCLLLAYYRNNKSSFTLPIANLTENSLIKNIALNNLITNNSKVFPSPLSLHDDSIKNTHLQESNIAVFPIAKSQKSNISEISPIRYSSLNQKNKSNYLNLKESFLPPSSLHDDSIKNTHLQEVNQISAIEGLLLLENLVLPEDAIQFIKFCETGTLYAYLQQDKTREQVKEDFFKAMFGRNHEHTWLPTQFPTISFFATELKKHDYRHLAHNLQRAESKIMIDGIAKNLISEGVWVTTIHDSVIVPKKFTFSALSLIQAEFAKHGLSPALRIEPL